MTGMATTSADILVRAVMTADSGLVEDQVINDFAFRHQSGLAPTTAELDDLAGAVDDFYNSIDVGTGYCPAHFISTHVDRAATHELEFVNIATGGSPVYSVPWLGPVAPEGDTNLPNEVAAVLSFHGTLTGILEEVGATRPRARRRGRLYVGPLRNNSINGSLPAPTLGTALLTALRTNANVMFDAADAAGFTWSVWSRMANELYAVVGGWTDNAPDTQRRRGQVSSARVTYST